MENDKLFELMTKMYGDMQDEFGKIRKDMQEGFKEVKDEIKCVKNELNEFREETNKRFDGLEDKLNDLEGANADRHLTIGGDIRKIKSSLSKVEIVVADNWGDIARIKASKRHRIK